MDFRSTKQRQRSRSVTLPPPVGGLNGRDSLASMPPKDAYYMRNWVPGTATVKARNGSLDFAEMQEPGAVETLMVYAGGATPKFLSAFSEYIYDITDPNAQVALQSGRIGAKIMSAMFSNAGAQFFIGCSGQDVPFSYNGTVLSNLVMTGVGVVAAQLNFPFAFKGRMFFLQTGKLSFFYLPVGQIQGVLTEYDLSQVAMLGGSVIAIASFSLHDAGSSPQDYCLFITSEGEYIVYGGFDPTSVTDWGLVGRYYGPPPIGRNCALNYGTDVLILTLEGAIPLSEIRRVMDANEERNAITSKLGSFLSDLNENADTWGWQALAYARGKWLVLNVPTDNSIEGEYTQFVMNTTTGAWTQFDGWNSICYAVFQRRLYFGTYDGRVVLADEGFDDNGEDIRLDAKQAYNNFQDNYGAGESNKLFHFARLTVSSEGTPAVSGELSVDFADDQPDYATPLAPTPGATWDVSLWDLGVWEEGERTQFVVISLGKYGTFASLWLRASLNGTGLQWYATRFIFEIAKGLVL